jgi:hypothetical protein
MRYALALLVSFAVGCAARPMYQAVKFAEPNPFVQAGCKLAVEEVHTDQLTVEGKPEAEWLAGRTPQQGASYQEDKRYGQEKFSEYLRDHRKAVVVSAGTQGNNVFVLRPTLTVLIPSNWGQGFGHAEWSFDVLNAAGELVDRFNSAQILGGYSIGDRIRAAYISSAWAIDQYLGNRWQCGQ